MTNKIKLENKWSDSTLNGSKETSIHKVSKEMEHKKRF